MFPKSDVSIAYFQLFMWWHKSHFKHQIQKNCIQYITYVVLVLALSLASPWTSDGNSRHLAFTSSAFILPSCKFRRLLYSLNTLYSLLVLLSYFMLLEWIVFVVHSFRTNADYAMLPQLVWFSFLCVSSTGISKWNLAESALIVSKRLKTIYYIEYSLQAII